MIALSGYLLDPTGYGQLARRVVAALDAVGRSVMPGIVLTDGSGIARDQLWPVVPKEFFESEAEVSPDQHLAVVAAPDLAHLDVAGAQFLYTCWETDRLPASYLAAAEGTRVIVPSPENAEVWRKHGVDAAVVPVAILEPPPARPWTEVGADTFVFYMVTTWQERKYPLGALCAYLRAFTAYDNVEFVVKVFGGEHIRAQATEQLEQLVAAMNMPAPPRVRLMVGRWTDQEIWDLHHRGDCYFSLTRGEAVGLPILDALAVGNRVVVTEQGGHIFYLIQPDGVIERKGYPWRAGVLLVSSRQAPVIQPYVHFSADQCWEDPSLLDATDVIQAVFSAGRLSKKIQHDFPGLSLAEVGWRLCKVLDGD